MAPVSAALCLVTGVLVMIGGSSPWIDGCLWIAVAGVYALLAVER
jgi:hypothetical protein